MTLVYGSPNQTVPLQVRGEANLALERAYTLDANQVLGDGFAVPRPLTLKCVYVPVNPDPTLGLEETMSHLITLGAALREVVRLDASLEGVTYTRALRPGGTLRVQRFRAGIAEYELELLPGEPWWRDAGGNPYLLWLG